MAVRRDRTTEHPQRLLPNPEAPGGEWIVGLRRHPRQHHRTDVAERDWASVVDDEKLASTTATAGREPELARAEVVAVLDRLEDALERSRAQASAPALRAAAARLEERGLLVDELRQPPHRRVGERDAVELDQI